MFGGTLQDLNLSSSNLIEVLLLLCIAFDNNLTNNA
jgi:hypothetical protein